MVEQSFDIHRRSLEKEYLLNEEICEGKHIARAICVDDDNIGNKHIDRKLNKMIWEKYEKSESDKKVELF